MAALRANLKPCPDYEDEEKTMINLERVDWRDDTITRHVVAEHEAELADPSSMTPALLACTITYCKDIANPYALELARRAGMLERYLHAFGAECTEVVRRAAKGFNILLH